MDFCDINGRILPPDATACSRARARMDNIAKPVGSLGELEDTVVRLAGALRTDDVTIDRRALIVMCADNGVLQQGVAQTPGEITAVMSALIAEGRSSVGIMARMAHVDLFTVDVGVSRRVESDKILSRRVADGTADMTQGPAMTRSQAQDAIKTGMELAASCQERGYQLLATGEMGIGNTTTSSAVASVLLGRDIAEMTGRGAGLSDEGLNRKVDAIRRAIAANKPDGADAFDVLCKLGGLDIAGLAGVFIGGALAGLPVLVDGFISAVSALVATRLCPAVQPYLFGSHASAEPADAAVLDALGLRPVIHAGMRLGEGTGAMAVLPLLDMTLEIYRKLPTFQDIGM